VELIGSGGVRRAWTSGSDSRYTSQRFILNNQTNSTSNGEPGNPVSGANDLDLVARAQKGDTGAFDALITQYRQRCFAMIYHMVRNEEDAWDLAQDGFVKAWKSLANFRGQSAFYTWLYRIMTNVSLDWLRKKHIQGAQEFDDTIGLRKIEPSASTAPKEMMEPAQRMADAEIRQRIDAAMEKLSPEHRTVAVLREIEGLDYQEIADAIGCSIGTVMSRLFYARKKLQTLLQDVYEQL
jgi:RNA polymerase sigma-70 factor, ECF subfamily